MYRLSAVLFCVVMTSGCAGYQLGNATLYRQDIRTVYVPMFESDSFRRNLGERLTEAVVKEIENTSSLKVISDPSAADSVLSGRIVFEGKTVLAETNTDEPRDVETNLVVIVNWIDRQGFAVTRACSISLAQQGFSIAQPADFIAEAGQTVSSAHQEAIQRVARQIVSQMEAPW